jgi:hypothetical protein
MLEIEVKGKRKLKKIYVIFILLFASLHAEMVYSAKGSLIGKIMDIRVNHRDDSKKYTIRIDMKAVGLAKTMSDGLKEHHTSHGTIRRGEYYAKEYKIDKTYKDIHYIRKYMFDYKKKKITKISTKWKKGKKLYENKETLKYFAHNDILTLYHNIMRFKKKNKAGSYAIALAGAEKEGGKLTFNLPKGARLQGEQKALGMKNSEVIKLFMRRSFFSGGKGNLVFGVDKKGIVKRGTLNSVKLLGKVTLKRIK